jgi:hypothetical protein
MVPIVVPVLTSWCGPCHCGATVVTVVCCVTAVPTWFYSDGSVGSSEVTVVTLRSLWSL